MPSLHFTTTLLGLGFAALLLYLVRRDHLHLSHGLFWIAVAALAAVFGLWPGLIDGLAGIVGIQYPPALLLLVAVMVLLVKCLHTDIINTRIERQVRRLNQRLALYEATQASEATQVSEAPQVSEATLSKAEKK